MGALIENGRIRSADIRFDRDIFLTCWLDIEFDGSGQGFGGYMLGGNPFDAGVKIARHDEQRNIAADFIGGVMGVAEVEQFSDLPGKIIRVRRETAFGPIVAIGHPFKDRWYHPAERLAILTGEAQEAA